MSLSEQKQFKLQAARQPSTVSGMHNTVVVYHGATSQIEYGYIRFDDSFIRAVGKVMPQGVSQFNPAFLQVHYDSAKAHWEISACYVLNDVRHFLWASVEFPVWLKALKKVGAIANDKINSQSQPARRRRTCEAIAA